MPDLAGAYADGRVRLAGLLGGLDDAALSTRVPACPAWTVRDLLAHVTGVAADAVGGTYFLDAARAWRDPALAAARDAWTAGQVRSRRGRTAAALAAEWAGWAAALESALAAAAPPPGPDWLPAAPVADLAVHLHDARGALGVPGDRDAPVTTTGLRVYARWLGRRLDAAGRPALRLRAAGRSWVEGSGPPGAELAADSFELFRALSGRRSLEQVRELGWDGGPERYLDLISPYPVPTAPLAE